MDKPDPFNLSLGRQRALTPPQIRSVQTNIKVKTKPGPVEYFRIHPSPEYETQWSIYEWNSEQDRQPYWVAPGMEEDDDLIDHLRFCQVNLAINRRGSLFVLYAKYPLDDSPITAQVWARTKLVCFDKAKRVWLKMQGDRDTGSYNYVEAQGDLGEPVWPSESFEDILRRAFKDYLIDTPNHAVLKEIRGDLFGPQT